MKKVLKKVIIRLFGKYVPTNIKYIGHGFTPIAEGGHKYRVDNYLKYKGVNNKIAFFTAITGGYEDFKLPEFFDLDIDYFVFTDDASLFVPQPFKKILLDKYESDPTRLARWVKLNPHKILSSYDYTIWVDSNLLVRGSLIHYVSMMKRKNSQLGFFKHPERSTLEEEITACKKLSKDTDRDIDNQFQVYLSKYGAERLSEVSLIESNVYIADIKSSGVDKFFQDWYFDLFRYSRRDQISLPIALLNNQGLNVFYCEDDRSLIPRFNKSIFEIFRHVDKSTYLTPTFFEPAKALKLHDLELISSSKSKSSISIVVSVYNAHEEVKELLDSLVLQTDKDFELVIVDDASDQDAKNVLVSYQSKIPLTLLTHDVNKGYTRTVNDGVSLANNNMIVVLNSDTVLPVDFVCKLKSYSMKFPNIDAFGPLTNAGSWQNTPDLRDKTGKIAINKLPYGMDVNQFNSQLCSSNDDLSLVKVNLLNGFCYAVRKEVYEATGLLDEETFPTGYGEEDDFFIRLNSLGFQAAVMTGVYVFHHKTKSFTSEQKKSYSKAGLQSLYAKHTKALVTRLVKNSSENPLLKQHRDEVKKKFY